MKIQQMTVRHNQLRDDLLEQLRRDFGDLPAEETLAVLCQIVGQMIAFQDQRRFTPEAILQIVQANIQHGNQAALAHFINQPAAGHA